MTRLPLPLSLWRALFQPNWRGAAASLPQGEARLDAGTLLAFEPSPDIRLVVLEGTLWVTQTGDERDYLVRPGQCFIPAQQGKVVAQAETPVRLKTIRGSGGRAYVCDVRPG